jgi:hypothetical protein
MLSVAVGFSPLVDSNSTPVEAGGLPAAKPVGSSDDDGPPFRAAVAWVEDFDEYEDGQDLHGVNGWKGWMNDPRYSARVTGAQARSAPHSVDISGEADLVREFDGLREGWWRMTAWQYVPSEMEVESYFIVFSEYSDRGTREEGLIIEMDGGAGLIRDYIHGPSLPIVTDRWVELVTVVFFDSTSAWGRHSFFYDGEPLYLGADWACQRVTCPPLTGATALDLFANYSTSIYYDDLSLFVGGCGRDPGWLCEGDVDGDGQVNPVDSGIVQANFGNFDEQALCNYDIDCDGQISPVDAGIVQSLFGTCEAPRGACP